MKLFFLVEAYALLCIFCIGLYYCIDDWPEMKLLKGEGFIVFFLLENNVAWGLTLQNCSSTVPLRIFSKFGACFC